jgi:hypothetical protein
MATTAPTPKRRPTRVGYYFEPYVGKKYWKEGYKGLRVLLLGESFHTVGTRGWREAAQDLLSEYVGGGDFGRTWPTIEAITTTGRPLSAAQRAAFWDRVAYANAVQKPMPRARHRPTAHEWQTVRRATVGYLRRLRPDVMLVFGKAIWEHLPDDSEFPGSHDVPRLKAVNHEPAYRYVLGPRQATLAGSFYHPTHLGRGRSVRGWNQWARQLLRSAKSPHRRGRAAPTRKTSARANSAGPTVPL